MIYADQLRSSRNVFGYRPLVIHVQIPQPLDQVLQFAIVDTTVKDFLDLILFLPFYIYGRRRKHFALDITRFQQQNMKYVMYLHAAR